MLQPACSYDAGYAEAYTPFEGWQVSAFLISDPPSLPAKKQPARLVTTTHVPSQRHFLRHVSDRSTQPVPLTR